MLLQSQEGIHWSKKDDIQTGWMFLETAGIRCLQMWVHTWGKWQFCHYIYQRERQYHQCSLKHFFCWCTAGVCFRISWMAAEAVLALLIRSYLTNTWAEIAMRLNLQLNHVLVRNRLTNLLSSQAKQVLHIWWNRS